MSIQLDDYQKNVVSHPNKDCFVVAGPGAGKTRSIVERISHLIESGEDPSRIVAISFTNDASDEISERISNRHDSGDRIHSKTTHSFCYMLFRSEFEYRDVCQPWTARGMIRSIFSEINYSGKMTADSVLAAINSAKRQTKNEKPLYEEDISELLGQQEAGLGHIFKRYEDIKHREDCLDFTDMIWHLWLGMLHNGYAKEVIQQKFDHIIVDESQDMSPLSLGTINCVAEKSNLMLMGDPRQSIYGFREADPDLVLDLADDRQMPLKSLRNNYRSCPEIVNITNNMITSFSNLPVDNCQAVRDASGDIQFYKPANQSKEAKQIVQTIQESDIDLEDWAVLYRNNAQSGLIEVECMQNEVPYNVSGQHFWELDEIQICLDYLRLVNSDFQDIDCLEKVYNKPNRYLSRDTFETIKQNFKYADPSENLIDVIQGMVSNMDDGYSKNNLSVLMQCLRRLDSASDKKPSHVIEGNIFKFMSLSRGEQFVNIDYGYNSKRHREMNLDSLVTIASQYDDISSFLKDLDRIDQSRKNDGLNLSTIHSSKGREFKAVAVAGFVDDVLPNKQNEIPEEVRVAYVALTRAEDEIHIFEPQTYNSEDTSRSSILNLVLEQIDDE